jgi:ketosteroid isomerase-like protein
MHPSLRHARPCHGDPVVGWPAGHEADRPRWPHGPAGARGRRFGGPARKRRLGPGVPIAAAVLIAAGVASAPAQPPREAAPVVDLAAARAALADTERAFSQMSRQQGLRAAFLAYLAEDAVIFRPGPVPGRAFVEARPSPPIELTWRPVQVEVATSGDLGYTTGPYEARSTDPAKSAQTEHGYFVTVWRRQADGAWKAVVDVGVEAPPAGADATESGELGHGHAGTGEPGRPGSASSADAALRSLLAAESAFAGDAIAHGARAAYLAAAADGARFYRAGAPPAVGRDAIARLLGAGPQRATSWRVTEAKAAGSGDLGYAYGETAVMKTGAPRRIREAGIYFRIWRRQGGGRWQIALDLVRELPAAATERAPAERGPTERAPAERAPAEPPPPAVGLRQPQPPMGWRAPLPPAGPRPAG